MTKKQKKLLDQIKIEKQRIITRDFMNSLSDVDRNIIETYVKCKLNGEEVIDELAKFTKEIIKKFVYI